MPDDAEVQEGPSPRKPAVRPRALVAAVLLSLPVAGGLHFFFGIGDTPRGPFVTTESPILVNHEGVALHGYDVVGYFTEERPIEGVADFEVEYEDVTFRFASEENRNKFLQDPESYIPAYGGYCALGISSGYKDGMHPEAFEIVDGRLFFNLTPSIHEMWRADMEHHIEQGDRHWPSLKHDEG